MRYLFLLVLLLLAASPAFAAEGEEGLVRNELEEARNADTPEKIDANFDIIERLYKGGSYMQTRQVCRELLNNKYFSSIPPVNREGLEFSPISDTVLDSIDSKYTHLLNVRASRQLKREMVLYYMASALYQDSIIKGNNEGVREAIKEFSYLAKNLYLFDSPQYQAEAYYWQGKGYFYLGEYNSAIRVLGLVAANNPGSELDIKSSLLLADALKNLADIVGNKPNDRPGRSPLDLPDDPMKVLKTRATLLREAEQELSKIFTNHPQSRYDAGTELRLIELRFQLKEYEDTERLAGDLLKRATPGSENYAMASYYQANAVYLQGRIQEAVELFRKAIEVNKNASANIRADLLYGYGWANARLAQSSSPENRLVNLTRAQAALRQAIKLMKFGRKRQDAVINLAPVLIEMGLYKDAMEYLRDLLTEPRLRLQANYLAGLAAKGLGNFDAATRYFNAVIEYSGGNTGMREGLDAMLALAELERDRSAYAESYEYYRQAQIIAARQRQFDLVAKASLGMAVAAAELGVYDSSRRQEAARRLGESIVALTAVSSGGSGDIHTVANIVEFRASALEQWSTAGPEQLDVASDILNNLKGRLLPRLREDELKYVQGKVLYLKARNMRDAKPLNFNSKISDYDPVFHAYVEAENILINSLQANPRGSISPRARYLLGSIYNSVAELKMELANFWRSRGLGAEAVTFEEEGAENYTKAVKPLSLTIVDSVNDPQLRIEARALIGKIYLALGQYNDDPVQFEKGLDEFTILVNEPTISPERKLEAVRDMATALAEKKRKQDAVTLLLPYVKRDMLSAIQAANILLELRQTRKAYELLVEGISAARERDGADSEMIPEAVYLAHSLGLKHAGDIVRSKAEIPTQEEISADALMRLSEQFPGSRWASQGLLLLGDWMLARGKWKLAVEKADAGISKLINDPRAVVTVQALYILKGRALLEGGRASGDKNLFEEARVEFARAERAATRSKLGRAQRAEAIREQGNAYAALGDIQEALRYYGRVFSIFYNEYQQADLARIAAAKIHASRGNYDLAVKILDGGLDQKMIWQYKEEYLKKIKQQDEGSR